MIVIGGPATSSITWDEVTGKPELADIATTGSVADLTGILADGRIPDSIARDTELADGLAGKAAASHGHTAAAVGAATTVHGHTGYAATGHTHGVVDLTATGTRDASTYLRGDNTWAPAGGWVRRSVSANTTAVVGEALYVSASGGARTVARPTTLVDGGRWFVAKSDNSANPVTLTGPIGGDPDGVRLSSIGAGVTLGTDGTNVWVESTTTAAGASGGGGGGGAISSAPVAAGTRPGDYDRRINVYLPSTGALRGIRGDLARAATGQLVDVVCGGDSRVAGYGSGAQNSWPSQMRARLTAAGIPSAGTGLVMVSNGAGTTDSRVSRAGSWTLAAPYLQWTATGATCTFVSDSPGTVVEVYYYTNSGAFTVRVDSGSAVTVTPPGGSTANIAKYTVAASDTTHTVTVTSTSASGYLIGFCVRRATGVLVHSVAVGGYTSTSWTSTATVTLQQLVTFINPAVFGLMLGCNDPTATIPAATTAANLTTILSTNNASRDKFLVAQTPPAASAAQWPSYVSALYDQADTLGLPLLDLNDRFGTPAQANAAGLLGSDLLHEDAAGCNDIARAVTAMVAA